MQIIDFILHIDQALPLLLEQYGAWLYLILFLVIFCETGLVVTPVLPGDSLLFAAGALAAVDTSGTIDVRVLIPLLIVAAIAGDNSNYWIGRLSGKRLMSNPKSRIFRPEYIEKTQHFFDTYGAKTVVLARFVVIVRTFAPFMAGLGHMRYPVFLSFSVLGGVAWISTFLLAGYFFGAVPVVQHNLLLITVGIVLVTTAPAIIEYVRHHRKQKAALPDDADASGGAA